MTDTLATVNLRRELYSHTVSPNQPEVALGRHFVPAVRKLRHHYSGKTEKQGVVPFWGGAQSCGGGSQDPDKHSQFKREHMQVRV